MDTVMTLLSDGFLSLLFIAGALAAVWAIIWIGVQVIGNLIYYFGKGKDDE